MISFPLVAGKAQRRFGKQAHPEPQQKLSVSVGLHGKLVSARAPLLKKHCDPLALTKNGGVKDKQHRRILKAVQAEFD